MQSTHNTEAGPPQPGSVHTRPAAMNFLPILSPSPMVLGFSGILCVEGCAYECLRGCFFCV